MSIYAQAAQSGMGAAQLMFTGENAQTRAAYNAAYAEIAQKYAYQDAKFAAESNISSVKQDKILSDTMIELSQQKAEAQAKVSAAAAGVSGTNVDQVVYMTELNESLAKQQNAAQAKQAIEQQKTAVQNAEIGLLGVPEANIPSVTDLLINAAGSIDGGDIEDMKAAWSN